MESEEENFEEIQEESESEEEDEDDEVWVSFNKSYIFDLFLQLQAAMAATTLYDYKKGLVRPLVPKKTFINDMVTFNISIFLILGLYCITITLGGY